MVDMGLSVCELQTCLHKLLHGEEALLVGVDTLFEFEDIFLGGKESS